MIKTNRGAQGLELVDGSAVDQWKFPSTRYNSKDG